MFVLIETDSKGSRAAYPHGVNCFASKSIAMQWIEEMHKQNFEPEEYLSLLSAKVWSPELEQSNELRKFHGTVNDLGLTTQDQIQILFDSYKRPKKKSAVLAAKI